GCQVEGIQDRVPCGDGLRGNANSIKPAAPVAMQGAVSGADVEIAHEGQVIRVGDGRYFEMRDDDAFVMEDEIQFATWIPAGLRWLRAQVGAVEPGGGEKGIKLRLAEKRIEIAGEHHGLHARADQFLEVGELALAVAVAQRQVHEENADVLEFEFDDELLHAAGEVMESFAMHRTARDKGVALFVQHGN